jgi:hypothetical protein
MSRKFPEDLGRFAHTTLRIAKSTSRPTLHLAERVRLALHTRSVGSRRDVEPDRETGPGAARP